ncbi:MAG: GGDEF domain-containing protein [Clostridia bacterium]|jgi:diguanylate cyclase (GGDEF)-like protein|nr:GGDEF domain-containing protein [Clostridia bacterium]
MERHFRFDKNKNKLLFHDKETVCFWKKSSLINLITPGIKALGEDFYFIITAYESAKNIEDDYFEHIKFKSAKSLDEKLKHWSDIVLFAGWGEFESFKTVNNNKFELVVKDPWELDVYEAKEIKYNMPFLCGKLAGLFSIEFKTNMRAEVVNIKKDGDTKFVKILISETDSNLKKELDKMYEADGLTRIQRLQIMNQSLVELMKELKEKNELLDRLSSTDSLTGIYNRRTFMKLFKKELSRVKRYDDKSSLLILDIDYFKNINDTYGHAAGDRALKRFSKKINEILREEDIFARLGGEEFSIILTNTPIEYAKNTADRIRKEIAKLNLISNKVKFKMTVSIGVVEINKKGTEDRLLECGDRALYLAKYKGRNRVECATGICKVEGD